MQDRQHAFRRNEQLEMLLKELNEALGAAEKSIIAGYSEPQHPVVLIVACARSGSTLMLQWLAGTGCFTYPTNLLSRFYAAPYIGARIQQLLTDPRYNFRDEFADYVPENTFTSDLGKTRGILAPNEFWYFWRRFFHFGEIQTLDHEALHKVDTAQFLSELAAWEAAFDKPILLKAHIINWIIPFIARSMSKVLFIHIIREPLYTAQSLLESRMKYFGTKSTWYSFKPPEYMMLKTESPCAQVAGQVFFTNDAISRGLTRLDQRYWLTVRYEDFCQNPPQVFEAIRGKFILQGFTPDWTYAGPKNFNCNNQLRITTEERDEIVKSYADFSRDVGATW